MKITEDGTLEWALKIGDNGFHSVCYSVAQSQDGHWLYFAGWSAGLSTPNSRDGIVGKVGLNGEKEWVKRIGKYHFTQVQDMVVTSQTTLLLTGYFYETSFSTTSGLFVTELNSEGEELRSFSFSSAESIIPYSVRELPSRGYVVAGHITLDSTSSLVVISLD